MKIASIICVVGLSAILAGCAVAEGDSDVGNKFQRGIQGQGQVVPNNPTSDSFGSEYR